MAGRPKSFDKQIALQKAAALFWKKGFAATSLDDLIGVMGIQKGSFYHTFKGKKQLFADCMQLHDDTSFQSFREMLAQTDAPIDLIKSLFLQFAEGPESDHLKGCFAGNVMAELSGIESEMTSGAKAYLVTLEGIFFEQIALSQANGSLKTTTDARLLARSLLNLWNGINITRRIYPNTTDLKPLLEFQLSILH